ncbi:MAG: hypothetical protein LUM44_13860 [Pyrinomonadaceae bacterium]|nr:hypothetical protein [Pyrinomonadaceae bacterium]
MTELSPLSQTVGIKPTTFRVFYLERSTGVVSFGIRLKLNWATKIEMMLFN